MGNPLYLGVTNIKPLKVRVGSSWVTPRAIRVWNGSSWVQRVGFVRVGSTWEPVIAYDFEIYVTDYNGYCSVVNEDGVRISDTKPYSDVTRPINANSDGYCLMQNSSYFGLRTNRGSTLVRNYSLINYPINGANKLSTFSYAVDWFNNKEFALCGYVRRTWTDDDDTILREDTLTAVQRRTVESDSVIWSVEVGNRSGTDVRYCNGNNTLYVADNYRTIHKLNPSTGALISSHTVSARDMNFLSVDRSGNVFFAQTKGYTGRMNANGTFAFYSKNMTGIITSIDADDERYYAVDRDESDVARAFNPTSGSTIWSATGHISALWEIRTDVHKGFTYQCGGAHFSWGWKREQRIRKRRASDGVEVWQYQNTRQEDFRALALSKGIYSTFN